MGRILSLAALGPSVFAGADGRGIAVSRDGGRTWGRSGAAPFTKVRVLLTQGTALYAGTDAEGVFVSRNEGRSWEPLGGGLPAGAQVFSLAGLKGRLFAGLYGTGLYVWESGARLWRKAGAVSPLALASVGQALLAGHNPGGILRSDDLGATWGRGDIAVSEGLGQAPVWELAAGEGFAIAGISEGIYRTQDAGRHWVKAVAGLPAHGAGVAFLIEGPLVLSAVFNPAKD